MGLKFNPLLLAGFDNTGTSGGGTGTVTSVGLVAPAIFTVTNSPVTSTGNLTLTLASESANTFFSAPNGSSGVPTFRTIVAADIPTLNQNTTGTASNITASSNSTLTTLSALSLPYSQLTGAPAAGANTALSNLASVAINTSLLPNTDNSITLGSATKRFSSLFGVNFIAESAVSVEAGRVNATSGALNITTPALSTATNLVSIVTGNSSASSSGQINNTTGTGTDTGDMNWTTGDGTDSSGSFNFNVGAASPGNDGTFNVTANNLTFASTTGGVLLFGANDFTLQDAHLTSHQNTSPTVLAQSGAGSGASAALVNATDVAGQVNLTSGTIGLSTGAQLVVTFAIPYVGTTHVTLTPAGVTAGLNASHYYVTSTTNDFTVNFATASLGGLTYAWKYQVIEVQ